MTKDSFLARWPRRLIPMAMLAAAGAGCHTATEPLLGPMNGIWDGPSTQVRPACGSAAGCGTRMTLDVNDLAGTLEGRGSEGGTTSYSWVVQGTRNRDGAVVLHATRMDGTGAWTLAGFVSADGQTFMGQSYDGTGAAPPATGVIATFTLAKQPYSLITD